MLRSAALALLAVLVTPSLAAAAPAAGPPYDYSWRLVGTVTGVTESQAVDTDYDPFLALGAAVEGFVGVSLPAGTDTDGIVRLSLFDFGPVQGVLRASVTPRSGFDGSRTLAAPAPFVFEDALEAFVAFDGSTGALLELAGTADRAYRNSPFAQFRWGAETGMIQQLANAEGQTEPSHYFSYNWQAEFLGIRQVPEPGGGLLTVTSLALLAGLLARRRRL